MTKTSTKGSKAKATTATAEDKAATKAAAKAAKAAPKAADENPATSTEAAAAKAAAKAAIKAAMKAGGETDKRTERAVSKRARRLAQANLERAERIAEAGERQKIGRTTYWNADPRELVAPIIEDQKPGVQELSGAFVTARVLPPKIDGPKEGRVREASGAVYDGSGKLLPIYDERRAFEVKMRLGNRSNNQPQLPAEQMAGAERLPGQHVYMGLLRPHFGHFMLESLCRCWYLLKSKPDTRVVFHADRRLEKLPSYMRHVFELLGLDRDRITFVRKDLIVDELIFPDAEFEIRWKGNTNYADLFRELHARNRRHHEEATPRRVYLTRRQLKVTSERDRRKQVANEEEIEELFASRGFTVLAPEKLSMSAQIAIAGGASQMAGLKGSALHMSLYNQVPWARVIQIDRNQSMNQCLIDGVKGMESHHVFCEKDRVDGTRVIDVKLLHKALREM